MYKEFFNLSAEPFRITPDPGFLFRTEQHKEALSSIVYGISKRVGFVCIIGEVGVGKTTILRSYLDEADEPDLVFVYIYNPAVSFLALLKQVFSEIGLAVPGDDIPSMVEALRARLIEDHKRHKTLVLLIDEAQNMPVGTLESLRMLSNLETTTEKLVQIVLVGQPELEQLLAERQLRQLESRIAVRTRLGPLSRADSAAYIRHRLKCVALDGKPVFTDGALKLIVQHAQGIPRRINVLCDSVLMTAFSRHTRPATASIVREVLRDLSIGRRRVGLEAPASWKRPLVAGLAGAALAAAVAAMVVDAPDAPPPSPSPVSASLAAAVPQEPAPIAVSLTPSSPSPSSPSPSSPSPPPAQEAAVAAPAEPAPPPVPHFVLAPMPDRPPLQRVVVAGDTLAGLIEQVYGRYDRRSLDWVQLHNPEITNVNRIQVGQVITLPPLPLQPNGRP